MRKLKATTMKKNSRQNQQMGLGRRSHSRSLGCCRDTAFQQIKERHRQRRQDHRGHREIKKEADEGQLEDVKAQVQAQQGIGFVEEFRIEVKEIVRPVGRGPVADHIGDHHQAEPDQLLDQRSHPVQRSEFQRILRDAETVFLGHQPCQNQIGPREKEEPDRGQAAEADFRFENRLVDAAEALIAEPDPIDDQINPASEKRHDEDEQDESDQQDTHPPIHTEPGLGGNGIRCGHG